MKTFHTLMEFLLHSESAVYIIMGLSLPLFAWFWTFLTGRDRESRK
jgi:hypothetical protein